MSYEQAVWTLGVVAVLSVAAFWLRVEWWLFGEVWKAKWRVRRVERARERAERRGYPPVVIDQLQVEWHQAMEALNDAEEEARCQTRS